MRWIIAAIVLIGMYSNGALACSCARGPADEPTAIAEALKEADLVFVGRIESKEKFTRNDIDDFPIEFERTQFYVLQSWKGEKATRVYVESSITCCLCGYPFPKTGSFLVYAYGPKGNGYYGTGACTRTKPLEEAKQEIAVLDKLVAEAKQ